VPFSDIFVNETQPAAHAVPQLVTPSVHDIMDPVLIAAAMFSRSLEFNLGYPHICQDEI